MGGLMFDCYCALLVAKWGKKSCLHVGLGWGVDGCTQAIGVQ